MMLQSAHLQFHRNIHCLTIKKQSPRTGAHVRCLTRITTSAFSSTTTAHKHQHQHSNYGQSADSGFLNSNKRAALTIAGAAAATSFYYTSNLGTATEQQQQLHVPAKNEAAVPLQQQHEHADEAAEHETRTIINWSGTHTIEVPESSYFEPESLEELGDIVQRAHASSTPIRPVGSALSPNGVSFHEGGMVSMAHMDQIICVDEEQQTVTVQAGARVSDVIEELRKHNLTLPNLASIAEQQMGGFVQVGAHGTGALIPPVDDFVKSLKLVTPGCGTVELTRYLKDGVTEDPLFLLARVGLGSLGILAEVTMQCIPAHKLMEHTYVLTRDMARKKLPELLRNHKHMRYMWIPYEDAVVVVTNDPTVEGEESDPVLAEVYEVLVPSTEERLEPLTSLLMELTPGGKYTEEELKGMGFGEIRDALLAINPLDVEHVKKCNKAEAEFWRRSEGYQIKPSDKLLQFDCGGEQWVWEVCFPTGTYEDKNTNDIDFMEELLAGIESRGIAAHSPIEQRWTASSSSFMSPAHGCSGGLHSWVGIIMYLPADNVKQREEITAEFKGRYCDLMRGIGNKVSAASHWAKLELPDTEDDARELKEHIYARYPVDLFNRARKKFDPKGILSNDLMNVAFSQRREE